MANNAITIQIISNSTLCYTAYILLDKHHSEAHVISYTPMYYLLALYTPAHTRIKASFNAISSCSHCNN